MSLITDLKRAVVDGSQQTLRAAQRDLPKVATGVGKAVEGLIAFPYTTASHIFAGSNTLQNNILTRTAETFNHMVLGAADLLTAHHLYSAAKALGIEQYTPFFTPFPKTIEGMATEVTNLAFLAALPAASRAIKTRMGIPQKAVAVSETPLAQELAAAAQGRAAAKQVLVARTAVVPEGYVQIPGGEFVAGHLQGQVVNPFAMKATPVTNAEWLQGVDGKPRYVILEWDQTTHTVVVKDISATPPAFLNPKLNLEAGEIATQGAQVLVKLMNNPSLVYDSAGRVFSGEKQPVVGVNYFHVQAWLQAQTLEAGGKRVYGLPTELQYKFVASNAGKFEFGTETGKLFADDGRKLAYFGDYKDGKGTTIVVDDPLYPAGPFGVQTTGNVWRWTEANPQETYPYGLRGGSWYYSHAGHLRAAFRDSGEPDGRGNYVGFSPVALPGLLMEP